jgi:hypothetical protein
VKTLSIVKLPLGTSKPIKYGSILAIDSNANPSQQIQAVLRAENAGL